MVCNGDNSFFHSFGDDWYLASFERLALSKDLTIGCKKVVNDGFPARLDLSSSGCRTELIHTPMFERDRIFLIVWLPDACVCGHMSCGGSGRESQCQCFQGLPAKQAFCHRSVEECGCVFL